MSREACRTCRTAGDRQWRVEARAQRTRAAANSSYSSTGGGAHKSCPVCGTPYLCAGGGYRPPSGSTAVTQTTAAPSSSDAARSTSALIAQSWSPAGSSRTCRTSQRSRLLGDRDQLRAAGVGAGADLGRARRSTARAPRARRSASQPASASSSPSRSHRRSAASSTRRNSALRTSTRNARTLRVTPLGYLGPGAAGAALDRRPRPRRAPPTRRAGYESTWRTSSPSHSMMSASSSVLASSGTVWRSAR